MVVDCNPVKFCRVDDPLESKLAALIDPPVMLPVLSDDEKRLVDEAVVAKKLVVVAFVPVALVKVNLCSVDEPVARKLVVEA